ncbi:MAG: hypothetical protein ACAI38_06955 [Myxococcota bacterium]|nr:hypothetical protein [Myxococcota bacterium]
MTESAAPAPNIGSHPLTGKLVAALRQAGSGLGFASSDIEQFRKAGSELDPEALLVWIRDLSTLAITLRNDIMANGAATQIEQGLIEPLCRVLETHVRAEGIGSTRGNAVEQLVQAERRKLEKPTGVAAGIAPKGTNPVGAYIRGRRKKDQ